VHAAESLLVLLEGLSKTSRRFVVSRLPTLGSAREHYTDFFFIGVGQENIWRFTSFYGEPRWEDKHLSWLHRKELKGSHVHAMVVMGDLNEVLYSFEKEGGRPRPN
jgi:hypothetical protein